MQWKYFRKVILHQVRYDVLHQHNETYCVFSNRKTCIGKFFLWIKVYMIYFTLDTFYLSNFGYHVILTFIHLSKSASLLQYFIILIKWGHKVNIASCQLQHFSRSINIWNHVKFLQFETFVLFSMWFNFVWILIKWICLISFIQCHHHSLSNTYFECEAIKKHNKI